jgi:peptide-methionine (R)-S-oxide reductase
MKHFSLIVISLILFSCNSSAQDKKNQEKEKESAYAVVKTEAEWREVLSEEEFYILREAGTERAFSSPLNKNYAAGTYVCAACGTPLFKSEHKFDSGTGWPSFDREIENNVAFDTDYNTGYARTEEHCATCGGHLGHVFDDGPKETTGKRHCINGDALDFIPAKDDK